VRSAAATLSEESDAGMKTRLKSVLRPLLPREIRPHRILSGPLRGAQIVTSWHDYPAAIAGYTELPLLRWFAKNVKPGETWLDVGAHYGYTAIGLSRLVGRQGRVFAFEPMTSTAGYLNQTRALNGFSQMIVLPLALGFTETLKRIELPATRGMVDSVIPGDVGDPKGAVKEEILVSQFDWLWPQICDGQGRVDGIKIDVQGMELEVLRGMAANLREKKPKLVLEIHPGVNRTELLDLLESLGYSRRAMPIEPVSGEVQPQYVDDRSYSFEVAGEKTT
jgi:FkbM family methyltransferase